MELKKYWQHYENYRYNGLCYYENDKIKLRGFAVIKKARYIHNSTE